MLRVSRQIAAELLVKYIEQGEALIERASLVGDFSDHESWRAARKNWTNLTAQVLSHVYDGSEEADQFKSAVSAPVGGGLWQVKYAHDLENVRSAIDVLSSLADQLESAEEPAGGSAPEQDRFLRSLLQQERSIGSAIARETVGRKERAEETDAGQEHAQELTSDRQHAEEPAGAQELESEPTSGEEHAEEPAPGLERAEEPAAGPEFAPARSPGSELAPTLSNGAEPVQPASNGSLSSLPAINSVADGTRQVFLAHGRDEKWKQAVARLLEQAGPHQVTVLNERPNDRRALVEQVDEHATGSRYAVILLTADDVGAPRLESYQEPYFSPRARQGVVFEMGFLVAALTPECVCVLYEDGVELPCDVDGISYVRLDFAGTWQSKLLLQLRKAGFEYDLNSLARG